MGRDARIECGHCGNLFPASISFAVPEPTESDTGSHVRCFNCRNLILCTTKNTTFEEHPGIHPE